MFETAVLSTGPQTKRVWTTFLGFAGQALLMTCLVLAPLISPQALPGVVWKAITLAPPAPPPPPPQLETQIVPRTHVAATHRLVDIFTAPPKVPTKVALVDDLDQALAAAPSVYGSVPGISGTGATKGILDGIMNSVPNPAANYHAPAPAPPPVKTPPVEPPRPPRITVLQMAEPIQRVTPAYPPLARTAHVSGTVELMGVLGTDGRIHEIKVLSGHPLLVKSAVDAVMQWIYRPTILNGQPVEVQAPISVRFILN
jgi:protein TonB